jgi:hypothetical protein
MSLKDIAKGILRVLSFTAPRVSNYGLPQQMRKWVANLERSLRHLEQNEKSEHALAICAAAQSLLMPIGQWW